MVSLAEYQASLEELEGDEEKDEEENGLYMAEIMEEVEEGPDEGELLVIRRALSGIASQEVMEQWENIFHTKCTMSGKVCSLIIDGGSCANVASKIMVDQLKISITPHPNPYRFNGSIKVRVYKSQLGVYFSCPLGKITKMKFGAILCPWTLVISSWAGHGFW